MESVLNKEVSLYPCYYITDKTPPATTVNLLTFLQSPKHREKVEAIRKEEDKEARDTLKALLPAITPSGIFNEHRTDKGLVQHSGLLQFDIDLKGNEHITNYAQLKEQICNITNVAYCGLSVSGRGFWGLIPIAYPEKHREHFRALKRAFAGLGITIDAQCINVARLRGYSFDPEGYFNHQAKVYKDYLKPEPVKRSTYSAPVTDDAQMVELYLREIERTHTDLTGGYGEWWEIGCSFATAFGENGRGYFHRVSQYHPDYTHSGTDKKYDECLKGYDFKLGTFFYYCKLANINVELPKREKQREPMPAPAPKLPVYEVQVSDIVETGGHTQYGPDFDRLITANYTLKDGTIIQVLYDSEGELIAAHPKAQPLARYFEKRFIPARLSGEECLLNIVTH